MLAVKAKRKAQRQANKPTPAEPLAPPPQPSGNSIEPKLVQQTPLPQVRVHQPSPADTQVDKVVNKQQSARVHPEADTVPVRAIQPQTAAPVTATVTVADGSSALPKGFFDDKKSDAIAQGEKPRTAADAAKDLQSFQREVDQLEEQQIAVAAEEANDAAERAAAQEEFEDKYEASCFAFCCTLWCTWHTAEN